MIYRQKNKKKSLRIVLIIIFVIIVLRLFDNVFIIRLFDYPTNYILDSQNSLLEPLKNKIVYFQDKDELRSRLNELERENLELKLNQIFNQSNVQEFEAFIERFGSQSNERELFRVIAHPPFVPFDIIKITGDLRSYSIGELVFYKNILIGQIIEKNNRYASVKLFSSPDTSIPVLIRGSQFEAIGLGAGRYVFEVSKDFEIEEGDIILYPEQNPYILGSVGLIESSREDLFKKIYFNVPVALRSLSYVSIERQNQHDET